MLRSQKGMSTIEMLPILMLFPVLIGFSLGFFGIVHNGILSSIGARNYAFETFRNRTSLNYLRDEQAGSGDLFTYKKHGCRFHGVVAPGQGSADTWVANKLPVNFMELSTNPERVGTAADHNETIRTKMINEESKTSEIFTSKKRKGGNSGVSPVWAMTVYGICLDEECCR